MGPTEEYKFIDQYTDALDNAPESVREFLWSDAYKGLIDGIAKYCNLSPMQKAAVSDVMFDIVIGTSEEADASARLTAAGIAPRTQDTIFQLGYDYFVDPAIQLTEQQLADEAEEDAEENGTPVAIPTTPRIAMPLTAIADRLKNASMSTATTRNYSLERGTVPTNLPIAEEGVETPAAYVAPIPPAPVASAPAPEPIIEPTTSPAPEQPITKSFDPYHEPIGK